MSSRGDVLWRKQNHQLQLEHLLGFEFVRESQIQYVLQARYCEDHREAASLSQKCESGNKNEFFPVFPRCFATNYVRKHITRD